MTRRPWWLLLSLLLSSACSYAIVRNGEINEHKAAAIERGLAKIRGLEFLTPVPMEVKSTDELRRYLQAELNRQYSPEEIRGLQRVYERLGLLPASIDLGEALLKLYSAQIAGFYDPHAGKLFLVPSGVPSPGWMVTVLEFLLRRDLVNEMLLAHELTHALQDQHFGLLAAAEDESNDDRALTLHAVLEGDATLAGFAYVFGGLPERSLLDLVDRLGAVPQEIAAALPDTPPVLRDSLVFQYSAGSRFVALAYLRGGWRAVDALLAHPPSSTEQILWPEKYYVRPDTPTDVRLGGLDEYRNDAAWSTVEENTLGALTVRILLEGFVDAARADHTASGWDGDRYIAYARDTRLDLYWMSVWDSEAAAGEFFSAEREVLARKFAASAAKLEGNLVTATGDEPYRLERRGDKVLLAIGVPTGEARKRMDAIWTKTVFVPQPVQLDLDLATTDAARQAAK
jgi:hypothetical protein